MSVGVEFHAVVAGLENRQQVGVAGNGLARHRGRVVVRANLLANGRLACVDEILHAPAPVSISFAAWRTRLWQLVQFASSTGCTRRSSCIRQEPSGPVCSLDGAASNTDRGARWRGRRFAGRGSPRTRASAPAERT